MNEQVVEVANAPTWGMDSSESMSANSPEYRRKIHRYRL